MTSIARFQVIQADIASLEIRFVPLTEGVDDDMARISKIVAERMGPTVAVRVVACREIPTPESGKHCFTISKVGSLT
jgi:hypothetical protein